MTSIAQAYVHRVADMPQLQHGAVRVGMWIAALAERQGGFPVHMYYSDIIHGYEAPIRDDEGFPLRDDDGNLRKVSMPGVAFRPATVMKSIEALEECGLLSVVSDGVRARNAHPRKSFTLHVGQGTAQAAAQGTHSAKRILRGVPGKVASGTPLAVQ